MRYIDTIPRTRITWRKIWPEVAWRIEDVAVFDQLRRNGYHYERCGGDWYYVDIPYIDWGGSLPLADGFILELNGTRIDVIQQKMPVRPKESQPKDEHPMQEIWNRAMGKRHRMKWFDQLKEILKWRIEIRFYGVDEAYNALLSSLDSNDGIEGIATVLPLDEQKLLSTPEDSKDHDN